MSPQRINFKAICIRTQEVVEAQLRANLAAGYPMLEARDPHDTPLAVVGGGLSAAEHLDELKEWKGDVWAINQTASWLSHHAPKANVWLFTVDPDECLAGPEFICGVQKAILSSACYPDVFKALEGKDVRMFHCRRLDDMELMVLGGGRCSASRAVMQAAWQGYKTVTFYGCEGSFSGQTHIYRDDKKVNQIVIRAGEREYITTPDLYMNTEDLARDFREHNHPDPSFPYGLKEKSGGLLRAMLEYPDTWEIVALSQSMRDRFDPTNNNLWPEEKVRTLRAA